MDINTKISYRGWIETVILSKGWTIKTFPDYKTLCIKRLKEMASTWLKDGRQTYYKTYLQHKNKRK